MYVCGVYICVQIVCVSAGAHNSQKRAPDLLQLELQVPVGCMAWVQGAELQSSVKAPNHRAISPAPGFIFS